MRRAIEHSARRGREGYVVSDRRAMEARMGEEWVHVQGSAARLLQERGL